MEEAAILAALRETNAAQCEPPLAEAEVQRIAQSVARYSPGENPASEEHLTDMGNARRLMKHCGEDLRYVRAWRKWLAWDGARWEKDETGEIERRAKSTILSIYDDLPSVSDDGKRSLLAKHAIRSQAIHRIQAMIGLAESEQEVAVRSEQFDRDPWLLNVANGTINLKTSLLREHDRNDLITKLAPVVYDPNAQCRIFDAFLDRIFAANRDLIGFVQRAVGYSLTGDTSERALFILHGTGRNGKSTLLNVLRAALGDYALRTPTETLLAKRDGAIPNDVARLKGARFVTASETEEGKRLAESFIKDVTGGDVISARFMRAEFFDFKPECKVWLATNHKPSIRGTDNGIWDRIRLIPFGVRIPESEEDKELLAKLCDELPGILRWAVDGCIAWQRDGLGTPTAVREATESYRNENDVLGRFVEDCCCVLSGASVRSSDLYEAYKRWCDQNGEHPQTQKAFSMRVAELGFEKRRHDTGAWWYGVGLLTGVHDLTDPDGSLRIDKTNRSHEGLNGKSRQDPSDPSGSVAALGEEAYARIRRLKEQFTKAAGSNGGAR
jgi:putative DNA primase/helicase